MGCNDYGVSYDWNEDARNAVAKKLQAFFARNDSVRIRNLYDSCGNIGFLCMLKKHHGLDDLPREYAGIEYEVKMDVALKGKTLDIPENKDVMRKMRLRDEIKSLLVPLEQRAGERFVPEHYGINLSSGTEHHFRNPDGTSVLVRNDGHDKQLILKQKSKNLPTRNGVMKRAEVFAPVPDSEASLLSYADTVARQGGAYVGTLEKTVASLQFVDIVTGRVYSVDLSYSEGRDKKMLQLEVEYAGLIVGFDGYRNNEKQLIDGLVSLAHNIEKNPPQANGWEMRLRRSSSTKTDFAQDAKKKVTSLP